MSLIGTIIAFAVSVAVAVVVAAGLSTQFVLAELAALGATITMEQRISTTIHDIIGMAGLYGAIIAVGFLIAFLVAGFMARRTGSRAIVFAVAGATSIAVAIGTMMYLFEATPIAAARTPLGFGSQILAGAIGGWIFTLMTPAAD